MSEYNVGNALLSISPSFRGVAEAIDRQAAQWGVSAGKKFSDGFNEEVRRQTNNAPLGPSDPTSTRQGTRSGGKFADGFKAKVDAALRSLPDVTVDANTSEADRKVAALRQELTTLSGKRIGIDIDEATALAEIDRLKAELDELARKSPSVRVQADTAAASAKLAEIQAEVAALGAEKADVDVDVDDHGSTEQVGKKLAGLSTVIIGMTPLIAPLGAALAAAGAGAAATFGTLAGAAGVAVLGFKDVGGAVDLLKQQATATGPALKKINDQLAQVNPATLSFAKFVQGKLSPELDKLKATAAGGLLPGVEKGLKALQPLFPQLNKFVGSLAKTMGGLFQQAGKALNSPFWKQFFGYIGKTAGPILTTFAHVVGNIATGFAGLIEAFDPVTKAIGKGLEGLTKGFADFGKHAGDKNSPFQSFLSYVKQVGPTVVDVFKNLFKIIGKLLAALAPLGKVMLDALDALTGFLAKLSPDQILLIVGAVAALAAVFIGGPVSVAVAAVAAAALIVNNWSKIAPVIQPVLGALKALWGFIVNTLIPVFVGIFKQAWAGIKIAIGIVNQAIQAHKKQLTTLWNAFKVLVGFIVTKVLPLLGPILKYAFILFGKSCAIGIAAIALVVKGIQYLVKVGGQVGRWFSGPFVNFFLRTWAIMKSTWHAVQNWFTTQWGRFTGAAAAVGRWFSGPFVHFFTGAYAAVRGAWDTTANWFKDKWKAFAGTAKAWGRAIANGFKTGFGAVEGFVTGVWGKVESSFKGAVNWVITHIINGFIGALDAVLGVFGVHGPSKLHPLGYKSTGSSNGKGGVNTSAYYAKGGVLPGYSPGRDSVHAMLSPGEGILVPEAVRAMGGAPAIQSINSQFSNRVSSPGHFAGGGTIPNPNSKAYLEYVAKHAVGGIGFEGVKEAAKTIVSAIRHMTASAAKGALKVAESPIRAALGHIPGKFGSIVKDMANGALDKMNDVAYHFIAGNAEKDIPGGGKGASGVFAALVASGLSKAQAAGVMGNMQAESGFSPTIVQGGGHSNNPAAAGGGGYGLVQWTPGSKLIPYLHGAAPSVASEVRALIEQLSGKGPSPEGAAGRALLATTTPAAAARAFGLKYERYAGGVQGGREAAAEGFYKKYAFDSGGYLPPGLTTVYNGTGKPEPVLTGSQWQQVRNNSDNHSQSVTNWTLNEVSNAQATAVAIRRRQQLMAT